MSKSKKKVSTTTPVPVVDAFEPLMKALLGSTDYGSPTNSTRGTKILLVSDMTDIESKVKPYDNISTFKLYHTFNKLTLAPSEDIITSSTITIPKRYGIPTYGSHLSGSKKKYPHPAIYAVLPTVTDKEINNELSKLIPIPVSTSSATTPATPVTTTSAPAGSVANVLYSSNLSLSISDSGKVTDEKTTELSAMWMKDLSDFTKTVLIEKIEDYAKENKEPEYVAYNPSNIEIGAGTISPNGLHAVIFFKRDDYPKFKKQFDAIIAHLAAALMPTPATAAPTSALVAAPTSALTYVTTPTVPDSKEQISRKPIMNLTLAEIAQYNQELAGQPPEVISANLIVPAGAFDSTRKTKNTFDNYYREMIDLTNPLEKINRKNYIGRFELAVKPRTRKHNRPTAELVQRAHNATRHESLHQREQYTIPNLYQQNLLRNTKNRSYLDDPFQNTRPQPRLENLDVSELASFLGTKIHKTGGPTRAKLEDFNEIDAKSADEFSASG